MIKLVRPPKVPDKLHKVPKILFQSAETSAFCFNWLKVLLLKDLRHGVIKVGWISKVREAHSVSGDKFMSPLSYL